MNTREQVKKVLDRFGAEGVRQVQAAIRETRSHHPADATCECEAMEALGVVIQLLHGEGRGNIEP